MIKYAILGLLHYTDMHGYRIKEHLERNFGHMWSINYGQIYPNLKQLEFHSPHEVTDAGVAMIARLRRGLTSLRARLSSSQPLTQWITTGFPISSAM